MTGATPVPEYSGGCDRILTAVPPADVAACSWTADARADEVEAGIVALWQAYGQDRDATLRDRLLLHGGGKRQDELWAFDLKTERWANLKPKVAAPTNSPAKTAPTRRRIRAKPHRLSNGGLDRFQQRVLFLA